ncbi:MAG: AMMECR1 family protein, partial [Acidobacteriota bacterium]
DEIEIEISVLTPSKKVPGPEALVVGRDGVKLFKSGRSAVFLPQVAVEQGWTRDQMLDRLCRKAGLVTGCWRERVELQAFQAEVFSESGHMP